MSGASITRSRAITSTDVLLIAAVPFLALFPLHNNDLWWHLATGKWIVAHHAVPRDDIFAWTRYLRDWVDNEWLSQVVFFGAGKVGGDRALLVLRALLFGAVAALLRRYSGRHLFPFALASAIALSHHWWELRPSVFSLVGLLGMLALIQRGRWWWLPPLFLVWANLHPGFLLGLIIFLAIVVARAIVKWGAVAPAGAWCASIAATFINPYGWRVYTQQLAIGSNREYRALLDEWVVPPWPFLLFAIAILVIGALSLRKMPLPRLIPLFATATLSLTAVRFEEYCAWIAVPVALHCLRDRRARWVVVLAAAAVGWQQGMVSVIALLLCAAAVWSARRPRRASAGFAWIAALAFAAVVVIAATKRDVIEPARYPDRCLSAVRGRVFNRLSWGGWLIWHGVPPFIDGRCSGQKLFFDYVAAQVRYARPLLARWGIDTVIVAADDGTTRQLVNAPEWHLVCRDEASLVFWRKSVQGREFAP